MVQLPYHAAIFRHHPVRRMYSFFVAHTNVPTIIFILVIFDMLIALAYSMKLMNWTQMLFSIGYLWGYFILYAWYGAFLSMLYNYYLKKYAAYAGVTKAMFPSMVDLVPFKRDALYGSAKREFYTVLLSVVVVLLVDIVVIQLFGHQYWFLSTAVTGIVYYLVVEFIAWKEFNINYRG